MKILGYILFVGACIAAVLMHFYTITWVYATQGMLWAFIAFILPPFSELILSGMSIAAAGIFNQYLMLWVGIAIAYYSGTFIIGYNKKQYAD